jgi:hypothetical protein
LEQFIPAVTNLLVSNIDVNNKNVHFLVIEASLWTLGHIADVCSHQTLKQNNDDFIIQRFSSLKLF